MKLLLAIVKSPAVRKAAIALLLAAAAAAGVNLSGCAQPAKSPALAKFQCRVAVLAPYVAEAAPQVVSAIAESQNPVQFLLSLGLTPADVVAVARAYQACEDGADGGAPLPDAAPADATAALPAYEAN